jgi:hypothetical protein
MRKDYKKIIISSRETVRSAFHRLSYLPTISAVKLASYYKDEAVYVIFNFDKENDKMTATLNGRTIFENSGEDLWGETIKHMRRLMHRNELGNNPKFYMKTEKGTFVDVSHEVKAA